VTSTKGSGNSTTQNAFQSGATGEPVAIRTRVATIGGGWFGCAHAACHDAGWELTHELSQVAKRLRLERVVRRPVDHHFALGDVARIS
jgi:hypothetical protein